MSKMSIISLISQCIIKMGGIDTADSYPEERPQKQQKQQKCKFNPKTIGATIRNFVNVKRDSEDALQVAVATKGPVSIEFNASLESFQFYQSGVYDDPACSASLIDHAATIVGYGIVDNIGHIGQQRLQYWKVKNSWGSNWGEQGYIRMSRNKQNQCGIASIASYPLV